MPGEITFEFDKNPKKYVSISPSEWSYYEDLLSQFAGLYLNRKYSEYKLEHSIIRGENQFYILGRTNPHLPNSFLGKGYFGKIKAVAAVVQTDDGFQLSENVYVLKRFFNRQQNIKRECEIFEKVYGFCELIEINGKVCMLMPKFRGVVLEKILTFKLHQDDLINLICAIIKSVVELSNLGIIHHDIFARNIIYNPKHNQAYIIDFGKSNFCTHAHGLNKEQLVGVIFEILNELVLLKSSISYSRKNSSLNDANFATIRMTTRNIVNLFWNNLTNQFEDNEAKRIKTDNLLENMWRIIKENSLLSKRPRSRY